MPITRNTMASKGKGSELQINKIGNFIKRISIGFHADPHIPLKSCSGAHRLYNTRKGNTYFLLGFSNEDRWTIHTNQNRLHNTERSLVSSTSKIPNNKFRISQCLTHVFRNQTAIPSRVRRKYFNRIRSLMLQQLDALVARKISTADNNRRTKTFFKFSYRKTTFFFGIYQPCRCGLPAAYVLSNNRVRCHIHQKENIITPAPPQQPNHMTINMNRTKEIWSNRLGIKYQKNINQYKDSPYLSDKCFTLYQRKDTQLTKAQTQRLERYLKSPKNSRICPLIANNLLKHSAFYVPISHCKKQVRKLQDQERLVRSSRRHRNMETTHTQITPTPTRQEVQNTLPSLSTQILTSYPPVISNDYQQISVRL